MLYILLLLLLLFIFIIYFYILYTTLKVNEPSSEQTSSDLSRKTCKIVPPFHAYSCSKVYLVVIITCLLVYTQQCTPTVITYLHSSIGVCGIRGHSCHIHLTPTPHNTLFYCEVRVQLVVQCPITNG